MTKRQFILDAVKAKVLEIDPNAVLILFGSRARGNADKYSDWDFLILTGKRVNQILKNKINDALFDVELETDQVLSALIQNQKLWENYSSIPFYKNINKDGIRI